MATCCTKTLSRDHDWPDELNTDAQCSWCGLFYSEFCDGLGNLFSESELTRRPTAADEQLRGEALASIMSALDWTPDTVPAHRTLRKIGQEIAGLRGADLVAWADGVRAQHRAVIG